MSPIYFLSVHFLLGRLPKEKVAREFPLLFPQKTAGGKISQKCSWELESK